MKTIYLLGWLASAIFLALWTPYFKDAAVVFLFNAAIPFIFLIFRMIKMHDNVDESKIKM